MHYRKIVFTTEPPGKPKSPLPQAKERNITGHWKSLTRVPSTLKNKHSFTLGKTKNGGLKKGGCIRSELFCYWCRKGVGFSEEELLCFHIKCPLCSLSTLWLGRLWKGSSSYFPGRKKHIKSLKMITATLPRWADKPEVGWQAWSRLELSKWIWTTLDLFFLFIQQWTRQELSDY